MRIVVLAGGIGGARFLLGLRAAVPGADITVIGNTGDDVTLFGLRVCPDLDTVMYTLGGGIHPQQGWGRADERFTVRDELLEYGAKPQWFTLGDRDLATHIVRTQMLHAGQPLSVVTAALCERWQPGVQLLPMSDDTVETHVLIEDPDAVAGSKLIHFQQYWVGLQARPTALEIRAVGIENAKPAPGVLDAIAAADVILFPPSNPVVSVGTILAVPGVKEAVMAAAAPVVGLSPIIGGRPVRGMADKVLTAIGVETTATAVALHYGRELLDGWLVDVVDAEDAEPVRAAGIRCLAVPLMMSSVAATAEMAEAALRLADEVKR
jgi:LPPG:FO 2-phospho-L-lactate transferase